MDSRERYAPQAAIRVALAMLVTTLVLSASLSAPSAWAETATLFDTGESYQATPFVLLAGSRYEVKAAGTFSVWPVAEWSAGTCGGIPGNWEGSPTGVDAQYVFAEPASSSLCQAGPYSYSGACVVVKKIPGARYEECPGYFGIAQPYNPAHSYCFEVTGTGEPAGVDLSPLVKGSYSSVAIYGGISMTITGPVSSACQEEGGGGGGGGGGSGPLIAAGAASNVQSTSATLNGAVTSAASAVTECYFEYGETLTYGHRVNCATLPGQSSTPVPVSADLTGLTPATTYQFRLIAQNGNGSGYGSAETFTTTGTSPPTVTTGYVYTGWGPEPGGGTPWYDAEGEALATGVVNPHGHALTYEFFYEFHPVYVAAASDLSPYLYNSRTPQPVTAGTSPIEVSAKLPVNIIREKPMWVRLAVYDGHTWTWGAEVEFEVTPPEPEATERPFLQANGGDAARGYDLRCQPGTWRYAGGFEYHWYGGFAGSEDGAEYHVRKRDAGHQIWCQVTPKRFDGSIAGAAALASYSTFPQIAGTLILPTDVKAAFEAGDIMYTNVDAGRVILACGAALLLPGVGEAECGSIALEFFVVAGITDLLKSATDPPDRHYTAVALPAGSAKPSGSRHRCPAHVSQRVCNRLSVLAARYVAAAKDSESVLEAFAVSRNRTLIARRKKDSETQLIQQGARKVYAGLLATALQSQERVGLAYADALRRARIDVRITANALRRSAKDPVSNIVGGASVKRLHSSGVSPSAIQRDMRRASERGSSFDLQAFLRHRLGTAALTRYYESTELNDVVELVRGLGRQRGLQQQLLPLLLVDIDKARAACTRAGRISALQKLLSDARPGAQGRYLSFLATALQPLTTGASTIDRYPPCLR